MLKQDTQILEMLGSKDISETIERLLKESNRETLSMGLAFICVMKAFNKEPKHSFLSPGFKSIDKEEIFKLDTIQVDTDGDMRFYDEKTTDKNIAQVSLKDLTAHERIKIEELILKIKEVFGVVE